MLNRVYLFALDLINAWHMRQTPVDVPESHCRRVVHVYTAIQITCSSITYTDRIPTIHSRLPTLDCTTRVPIGNDVYCDIVRVTTEHATYRIPPKSTAVWVFALVVAPTCKTVLLQLDPTMSSIVPLFIHVPNIGTVITIQSTCHVFTVEKNDLSARIIPHLLSTTDMCDNDNDACVIVPTLQSCHIVESCFQVPIRTWENLMTCSQRTSVRVDFRGRIRHILTGMYDSLMPALFKSIYDVDTIFNDESVYRTYASKSKFFNALNGLVAKISKQSDRVDQLEKMFALHGYQIQSVSDFTIDIADMFTDWADVQVTYDLS
jgi:hypothetical protein